MHSWTLETSYRLKTRCRDGVPRSSCWDPQGGACRSNRPPGRARRSFTPPEAGGLGGRGGRAAPRLTSRPVRKRPAPFLPTTLPLGREFFWKKASEKPANTNDGVRKAILPLASPLVILTRASRRGQPTQRIGAWWIPMEWCGQRRAALRARPNTIPLLYSGLIT